MKALFRWVGLAAILASSAASAQQAKGYTCTDSHNVVDHYWFGPGFFQTVEDREFGGSNECTEKGSFCRLEGTSFTGTGATWSFHYDGGTGAYSLHYSDGYDETGTCKPD